MKNHNFSNIIFVTDILSLLFDILANVANFSSAQQVMGKVIIKSFKLLTALAHGNNSVQQRVFDRIESLLRIKGFEKHIALLLKEVYRLITIISKCYAFLLKAVCHLITIIPKG